ncbi:MAG TPA: glycosyltransferase [Pseudonocardia sp.]|nr:glycosyltransferase [Pseudonocardia sp.]
MRIHILGTRGFPSTYGGFETLIRHLAPDLVRRGHEVTVFDREPASSAGGRVRMIDGVRVYSSPGLNGTTSSTLSHGLTSSVITAREKPHVALVMNVANGFFLPALRARNVPVVLNVDGIEWERDKWSPLGKRVFKTAAKATARWADYLIADSEAISARWLTEFDRESVFVPYGGDLPGGPPGTERVEQLGLTPGGYVLIVARLVPENNVATMLDAAKRTGAPVVVVGSAGGNELEQQIRAEHNPPRVHALGHVSDQELLSALWAHCGVYLHGHSVGGTNPALVQAMGLGAPVLALHTQFNREVLASEDMVVPLDPEVIARRAVALLRSPRLRADAANWGRRRVAEVYNWSAVCEGYETVLLKAARSEPAVEANR